MRLLEREGNTWPSNVREDEVKTNTITKECATHCRAGTKEGRGKKVKGCGAGCRSEGNYGLLHCLSDPS